jgi:trk system potassium uptake protein TrkA
MYIVVAGGGMVGGRLVRRLLEKKHDVVMIDTDREICNKLYAETGVVAVHGKATKVDVLKEAGVERADVVVVATPDDADNLASAILAKSLNVPRVIVRMRDPDYENAYKVAGVNKIVRVTDLMVNQMMMEIENPKVRRITTIGGGRANIFMVIVPKGGRVAGKTVKAIADDERFPSQCVFIAIYGGEQGELCFPQGEQVVGEGDELFLISTAENIRKVADFLTAPGTA